MRYNVVLASAIQQHESALRAYISPSGFPSRLGHQRALSRVPCAKQYVLISYHFIHSFNGSVVKNPPANAGDTGSIPWLGTPPREGNGNPRQYPCLGNPTDREAWWATVHRVAESDTTEHTHTSAVHVCEFQSPNSFHPPSPPWCPYVYSLCLCVAETSTWETKHQRAGEFSFITLAGPQELTLQALSPNKGITEFL